MWVLQVWAQSLPQILFDGRHVGNAYWVPSGELNDKYVAITGSKVIHWSRYSLELWQWACSLDLMGWVLHTVAACRDAHTSTAALWLRHNLWLAQHMGIIEQNPNQYCNDWNSMFNYKCPVLTSYQTVELFENGNFQLRICSFIVQNYFIARATSN